jgi:hypothetical protein
MNPVIVTAIATARRQEQLAQAAQARRVHQARHAAPARPAAAPAPGLRGRARRALRLGIVAPHTSKHQKAGA